MTTETRNMLLVMAGLVILLIAAVWVFSDNDVDSGQSYAEQVESDSTSMVADSLFEADSTQVLEVTE